MATKKIIEIEVKDNISDTSDHVKKLNKEVKNTEKAFKDTEKATGDVKGAVDGATGGMISKFQSLKSTLGNVINSFGLLKTAIIGTGIGALLVTIIAIKQAFTSSEEGQNRWAKIMQYIGTIVGNVTDILTDMGNKLIWIFTHPVEALKNFTNLLKENIVNRFTGLLELIPNLGKAINKLFSGDFKEAGVIATNAVAKVTTGVDNLTGKINAATKATKDFIKEQERELKIAEQIADKRAKADRIERDLITQRAKADRDIADLRDKAVQKDIYSVNQRLKFLTEAQNIENSIASKEIKAAKLKRDAIIEENKLSNSNKEALRAEAEAKAKVIELETRSLQANKALNKALYTARQEARADAKTEMDEKQNAQKEYLKSQEDVLKKIKSLQQEQSDALLSEQEREKVGVQRKYRELIDEAVKFKIDVTQLKADEKRDLENIEKKYAEKQRQIEQDLIDKANEYKIKAQNDLDERLAQITQTNFDATQTAQQLEITAVNDKYFELQSLAENNAEVLAEIEIAKTNDLAKINEKYRKDEAQKELEFQMTLVKTASSSFGALGALSEAFAGKTEEDQKKAFEQKKAFDIAQAVVDGYGAALSAYKQALPIGGPILGAINAGIAGAFAIAQIRKIEQSTFTPSTPSIGGGATGGGQQQERIQAPTFNVIGEANQTQQVTEKPIKAYVVSGEVTTQQALDRNRLRNATL